MNKNLKDTNLPLPNLPLHRGRSEEGMLSNTRTSKLITALYMVTDIIDPDEPLRNKLRTLGLEILSDPEGKSLTSYGADTLVQRVETVMSLLSIASAMNFISEMNCKILTKEFLELKGSVMVGIDVKPSWLEEFLGEEESSPLLNSLSPHLNPLLGKERGNINSKGHTRIGVQKGSTLLGAIKDMSDSVSASHISLGRDRLGSRAQFDILKKQRRDSILNIIKNKGGSATIKDIMGQINTGVRGTLTCSEKTLQRELMSMTKDGALNKTGEKRWSRYGLAAS